MRFMNYLQDFKALDLEWKLRMVCDMYFDAGLKNDKVLRLQAKELKEILINELRSVNDAE